MRYKNKWKKLQNFDYFVKPNTILNFTDFSVPDEQFAEFLLDLLNVLR